MKKLSVSLTTDHVDRLDERQENGDASSRSAALREILDEYEQVRSECESLRTECEDLRTECETLRTRVDEQEDIAADNEDLRDRVDELETTVDRLRNEKRLLLEDREEKKELVRYAEEQRTVEQQYREAGLTTRMKWKLFGMPSDETSA